MDKIRTAEELTEKQKKIFWYLWNTMADEGYTPTFREIGEYFSIKSTFGVNRHLEALEKKGFIKKIKYKSRRIEILKFPGDDSHFG